MNVYGVRRRTCTHFIYVLNSVKAGSAFYVDVCFVTQSKIGAIRNNVAVVYKVIADTHKAAIITVPSVHIGIAGYLCMIAKRFWKLFGTLIVVIHARQS